MSWYVSSRWIYIDRGNALVSNKGYGLQYKIAVKAAIYYIWIQRASLKIRIGHCNLFYTIVLLRLIN